MAELFVTSILGQKHGPLVSIQTHSRDFLLRPDEARDFALNILRALEAAESDAVMLKFMTEKLGLGMDIAGPAIRDLRGYRTQIPPLTVQGDEDA